MLPAGAACAQSRKQPVRLIAMEMVHGAAGSTAFGIKKNMWAPAATGSDVRSVADQPEVARAVPRLPDDRQQHRRAATPRRSAAPEIGADHFRIGGGVPHAVASRSRRRARTSSPAPRSIRSTRRSSASRRRSRRCSCASRTSIRRAAAPTTTPASTPTRSAGRRRPIRCR